MFWIPLTIAVGLREAYLAKKQRRGGESDDRQVSRNKPLALNHRGGLWKWRGRIQLNFLALTLLIAYEFIVFSRQVTGGGLVTVHRPPGVEAFLPISALLGLKRWILTGQWDYVHPAGLTILLAIIIGALVTRRAFCAWICPVGAVSRALEWGRHKLPRLPPRWNTPVWLRSGPALFKYLLLLPILWMIVTMPLPAIEEFLFLPYNLAVDAYMLHFFISLSYAGILVIAGLVILSIGVRNSWCRFLCPYGALLAIAGILSPFCIVRHKASCTECGNCTDACGMGIRVSEKKTVRSLECTSCMACISSCPVNGVLEVRSVWNTPIRPWIIPAAAVGILILAYAVARAAGFWETSLTLEDFGSAYRIAAQSHWISHHGTR